MVMDNVRIIIVWFLAGTIAAMLCVGCTRIEYRDVKVPVPVPCDNEPTDLLPIPLAKWENHDNGYWPIGKITKFMDDAAESMIILKTQRANFKERLDACR